MRRISIGVLMIALASLVLELMLTRVFDVILIPNMSYFVVTMAVFAFGLAGIYAALRPLDPERDIRPLIGWACVGFALATVLLIPLIDLLPLDFRMIKQHTFRTVAAFIVLYAGLVLPFFLAGWVLIAVFSKFSERIQRLYFWDLAGAGLGSVLVVPFIMSIGPGGLMLCACGLALFAAAIFFDSRSRSLAATLLGVAFIAYPFIKSPDYVDFTLHMEKRGVRDALAEGRGEFTRWDPVSKINVIDQSKNHPEDPGERAHAGERKAIQYDGGNQTSYFYKFDGDLKALRATLDHDLSHVNEQFWQVSVLASDYLKRDTGQQVLILGSAGGQETKAALVYGASHVDAVELVGTVVDLGKGRYASYIGNFMNDPRVNVQQGEGRSFVRHSNKLYDIIQIYSNHTSSSAAQGTGAMEPVYLQTADAYEEYFSHLKPDGIVQINHMAYPRMVTTAALAWKRMGRTDFQRHVAVFTSPSQLPLPALLIKMSPWTPAEIASLQAFLNSPTLAPNDRFELQEDPIDPGKSFLSKDFYSGDFPAALAGSLPYDVTPRTDNHPYFRFMRKHFSFVVPDQRVFLDAGTASFLNSSLETGVPMDVLHLFMVGGASVLFILLFVLVPLRYSTVGRQEGAAAVPLLIYFSCLGAGFITLELVLIQKFMHLIGSPLYTYSTVIFTLLLAAGIGSTMSEKLGIDSRRRWPVPFAGILVTGTAIAVSYPALAHFALSLDTVARVLVSGLMIFPLGFFLGMPFPIGVLAIANRPRGAVAWAWGMNGLFTVAGGLMSVLVSIFFGFNVAIGFALALYMVAFAIFRPLRDHRVPGFSP